MGKNKLAKFDDMSRFENVFEWASVDDYKGSCRMKGKWGKLFFGNENPIVLELGCGKGEYTTGLAEKMPDKNFIGIDIKGARMWSGAKYALTNGLKNVAFLRTHIEFIDAFFGEGEVAEIWITFPDPQMKKVRKRMTSQRFLYLYRTILQKNGLIHLKCDSNFMFTFTKELVRLNRFPILSCIEDLYSSELVDDVLSIKTYYEQQWLTRGITIKYLQFLLPQEGAILNPEIEIEPDSYRSFNRNRRTQIEK